MDFAEQGHKPKQTVTPQYLNIAPKKSELTPEELTNGVDHSKIPKAFQNTPVFGGPSALTYLETQRQLNAAVPKKAQPKLEVDPTSQSLPVEGSQKPSSPLVTEIDYGKIPKAFQNTPVFGGPSALTYIEAQRQLNAVVPEQTQPQVPNVAPPAPIVATTALSSEMLRQETAAETVAFKPSDIYEGAQKGVQQGVQAAPKAVIKNAPGLTKAVLRGSGGLLMWLILEGVFAEPAGDPNEAETIRQNKLRLQQKKQAHPPASKGSTPTDSPASAPAPISTPVPVTPAKAQSSEPSVYRPSAEEIQLQQQEKVREAQAAAQAKQWQEKFDKERAAWNALQAAQSKLNDFSSGYSLSGGDLDDFSKGLTPQQREAVQAQATARNNKLTNLAQQAGMPLSKEAIKAQEQQLVQQELYKQYTPAREIYHFASEFLNGYTAEKMKAVRGYFDQVFAGTYSKGIPEGKRAGIEADADAKYTTETGKQVDRNSPLWKTLRNIEASEKYPDLWDGFRTDLNTAAETAGVMGVPQPQVLTKPEGSPNPPPEQGDKRVPVLPKQPEKKQPGIFIPRGTPDLTKPQQTGEKPPGIFKPKPIPDANPKSDGEPAKNDPSQAKPVMSQSKEPEPSKENTANEPKSAKKDETKGKKDAKRKSQQQDELNPADRVKHEEYIQSLRQQMGRPHVEDPELNNFVGELYRQGASIGSGSTADAIRHERETGQPVKGKEHSEKGMNAIRYLEKWLKKNPTARPGDRAAAENILRDLKNALELE
jgi:hypothetical protein